MAPKSKEVEIPGGGGGGKAGAVSGMLSGIADIANSATNSTDKLLSNIYQVVQMARDRKRQAELDREAKREFGITVGLKSREQNMGGIGMLAEQRNRADMNSRLRTFKTALTS